MRDKTVPIRLSSEELRKLDDLVKIEECPRSEVIRKLIEREWVRKAEDNK